MLLPTVSRYITAIYRYGNGFSRSKLSSTNSGDIEASNDPSHVSLISWTNQLSIFSGGVHLAALYGQGMRGRCQQHARYRGQDWYFMQDGARIHTAKLTMQLLKEEGVRVWAHPARSPDLNPIEHMWHLVKCEMRGLKFETGRIEARCGGGVGCHPSREGARTSH